MQPLWTQVQDAGLTALAGAFFVGKAVLACLARHRFFPPAACNAIPEED
jgi:hypothetical protein